MPSTQLSEEPDSGGKPPPQSVATISPAPSSLLLLPQPLVAKETGERSSQGGPGEVSRLLGACQALCCRSRGCGSSGGAASSMALQSTYWLALLVPVHEAADPLLVLLRCITEMLQLLGLGQSAHLHWQRHAPAHRRDCAAGGRALGRGALTAAAGVAGRPARERRDWAQEAESLLGQTALHRCAPAPTRGLQVRKAHFRCWLGCLSRVPRSGAWA
mmetsp:Transcript_87317/g.264903  ORF Transcript_87317/g.264903 Transcript_87317/m.264903 type:complete len:216 (+) Transcript_87317:1562-2209(+)